MAGVKLNPHTRISEENNICEESKCAWWVWDKQKKKGQCVIKDISDSLYIGYQG